MFICLANRDRVKRPFILSPAWSVSPCEVSCFCLEWSVDCWKQKWGKTQSPRSTGLGMMNIGTMNDGYHSKTSFSCIALCLLPINKVLSLVLIRFDKPDLGKRKLRVVALTDCLQKPHVSQQRKVWGAIFLAWSICSEALQWVLQNTAL